MSKPKLKPKCHPSFIGLTDLDGNTLHIRVAEVVAFGESLNPKYTSWVMVQGSKEKFLLAEKADDLAKILR